MSSNATPVDIRALLYSYTSTLRAIDHEPAISFRGLFRFYGLIISWSISIYPALLFLFWNLVAWSYAKLRHRIPRYAPNFFFRPTLAIWRALHEGEIPGMNLIPMRFFIRLFALYHIQQSIRRLDSAFQLELLDKSLSQASATELTSIREQASYLRSIDRLVRQRAAFRLLLALSPGIGGLLIPIIQKNIDFITKQTSTAIQTITTDNSYLLITSMGALYLLLPAVSSFIRKRQIFLDHAIYQKEYQCATSLTMPPWKEFPFDLLGSIATVVLSAAPSVLFSYQKHNQDDSHQVYSYEGGLIILLYFTPLIYALVRRTQRK